MLSSQYQRARNKKFNAVYFKSKLIVVFIHIDIEVKFFDSLIYKLTWLVLQVLPAITNINLYSNLKSQSSNNIVAKMIPKN